MQRFENILCVISSGQDCDVVLERAVQLAMNHQANLSVVEVLEEIPAGMFQLSDTIQSDELREALIASHRRRLQRRIAPWGGGTIIRSDVLVGIPFLEIIREVQRRKHDLVIKIADSGGLLDRMFGSDDMHLLRKCPCPVWLVKPNSPGRYRTIMAAVDAGDRDSPEEQKTRHRLDIQVIELAGSLALSEFAQLHVVHAWEEIGERLMRYPFTEISQRDVVAYMEAARERRRQQLDRLVKEALDKADRATAEYLKPQIHLLKGSPRTEIPAFARSIEADLVVMGTVARTGISGLFMGNTAETILNQLNCSIVAIKPPGFITPVKLQE